MNAQPGKGNLLDYFSFFFRYARVPSRIILIAYFVVFLITPIYGRVGETSFEQLGSALLVAVLAVVQVLTILVIFGFRRRLPDNLRRAGWRTLVIIAVPFVLFLLSSSIAIPIAPEYHRFLQIIFSVAMVVPLAVVVVVLVESVIRTPLVREGARLPMGLAAVTIFLVIYTFGAVYFINGMIVTSAGQAADFTEALYASGLAFTSLGFTDVMPVGIGKPLSIIESIAGYVTIALITTILVRIVLTGRMSEDDDVG